MLGPPQLRLLHLFASSQPCCDEHEPDQREDERKTGKKEDLLKRIMSSHGPSGQGATKEPEPDEWKSEGNQTAGAPAFALRLTT